jgi:hypothetical protein
MINEIKANTIHRMDTIITRCATNVFCSLNGTPELVNEIDLNMCHFFIDLWANKHGQENPISLENKFKKEEGWYILKLNDSKEDCLWYRKISNFSIDYLCKEFKNIWHSIEMIYGGETMLGHYKYYIFRYNVSFTGTFVKYVFRALGIPDTDTHLFYYCTDNGRYTSGICIKKDTFYGIKIISGLKLVISDIYNEIVLHLIHRNNPALLNPESLMQIME